MKNKILLALLLLIIPIINVSALKSNHISIGVKDINGNIVQYAHAELLSNKKVLYSELVNTGVAEFDNVKSGKYTIRITADTYETYTDEIIINNDKKQEFNYVITQKEEGEKDKEPDSKINITIYYFNDINNNKIGNTPDEIVKKTYDLYLDEVNKINVDLEKSSYITSAMIAKEITYVQSHDASGVELSLNPTKKVYDVIFYVQRNWTSRLYYYETKYEDDTWSNFLGFDSYIEDTDIPKSSTYNMVFGEKVNLVPKEIENFDLYNGYALYYYNGGVSKKVSLEEMGLSMEDGKITGYGPVLSQNEYLLIYFYYTESTGNVLIDYLDENNNKLIDTIELKGKINKEFESTKKDFDGYEFVSVTGNENNTFTKETKKIVYKYKKIVDTKVDYEDIPYTGITDYNNGLICYLVLSVIMSIYIKKFN